MKSNRHPEVQRATLQGETLPFLQSLQPKFAHSLRLVKQSRAPSPLPVKGLQAPHLICTARTLVTTSNPAEAFDKVITYNPRP
jgi:hypothetical protein